jgi:hypothetical protein
MLMYLCRPAIGTVGSLCVNRSLESSEAVTVHNLFLYSAAYDLCQSESYVQ